MEEDSSFLLQDDNVYGEKVHLLKQRSKNNNNKNNTHAIRSALRYFCTTKFIVFFAASLAFLGTCLYDINIKGIRLKTPSLMLKEEEEIDDFADFNADLVILSGLSGLSEEAGDESSNDINVTLAKLGCEFI